MHGHSTVQPPDILSLGHDKQDVPHRDRRREKPTEIEPEDRIEEDSRIFPEARTLVQERDPGLGRGRHYATAAAIHGNPPTPSYRPLNFDSIRFVFDDMSVPTIRRLPTVRFSGTEGHRSPVPTYRGRNIYEEQERQYVAHQQPELYRTRPVSGSYTYTDGYLEEGNEVDFDESDLMGLPEDKIARDLHGIWDEVPEDRFGHEVDARPGYGGVQETTGMGSGFWRPNKLY